MPEVTHLVIDRATHARGFPSALRIPSTHSNYLYPEGVSGRQCCLGFYCAALGVRDAVLAGVTYPRNLAGYTVFPGWLFGNDASKAAAINDAPLGGVTAVDLGIHTEADRERLITEIFARHGVTVEWVGEMP